MPETVVGAGEKKRLSVQAYDTVWRRINSKYHKKCLLGNAQSTKEHRGCIYLPPEGVRENFLV